MTQQTPEQLIEQLTLEEQVSLLSGEDFWSLPAIERLGIPKFRVTDGPNGARGGGSLVGGVSAAAFPVGIALGASWDPELAFEIGAALADEVKSKSAHALLAPTVNIHRSGTNGRNFECYAEDPELTADLAVEYIKGLQSKKVAATIKHFVANESEIQRTTMSSDVDEQSLREIYLRPFEDAVKHADTWAIMSSYNRLNGTYTSEHPWLLTKVLREQWGYEGVVMSDWFGSSSTAETVNAGLDLEMPGPTRDRGQKLVDAVNRGDVEADTVKQAALNILRLMEKTGALQSDAPFVEVADNRPEHQALIRRAGAEASVLLKNDGILPLSTSKTIAVIGPNAKTAQIMGGGSAQLNPHYRVSPWDALNERLSAEQLHYAQGCTNHRWEPLLDATFEVEYFASSDLSGEVVHRDTMQGSLAFLIGAVADGKVNPKAFSLRATATMTPDVSGTYQVGAHGAGLTRACIDGVVVADAWTHWQRGRTFFEEGCDEVVGSIELEAGREYKFSIEFASKNEAHLGFAAFRAGISKPLGQSEIDAAVKVAAEADIVLLLAGRSGEWDTEGSDLEHMTLPGLQDQLISQVAAVNRNTVVVLQTGGPVEMPWLDQVAAVMQSWYPGQEAGNAIVDVLFGEEPGGRLPQSFPVRYADNCTYGDASQYPGVDGHVEYKERLHVGYRHHLKHNIKPLFPFGFGLSYTQVELISSRVTVCDKAASVSAELKNTGERHGSTVLQVYVAEINADASRPVRALKAFRKVKLAPSESQMLTLDLDARDFAYFDVAGQCWRVNAGQYDVMLGFDAENILSSSVIELEAMTLGV